MQGGSQEEWKEAKAAAAALGAPGAELVDLLGRSASCLIMDYVPGTALFEAKEPFEPAHLSQTACDLGRYARMLVNRWWAKIAQKRRFS